MFGYITINRPELKIKDEQLYQSYYCGLCRTLKERYGKTGQMTLTYDMTFLLLLLTGLYEPECQVSRHRCMTHPTRKHAMLQNSYTDYCADMNILLTYHNCMDDWFDDKSLVKLSAAKLLEKKYQNLQTLYPRQTAAIETYMTQVRDSEAKKLNDLDLVAGYTGTLLGELFVCEEDVWSDTLRRMGFFLGKFIYLMDAYDDLAQDEKKHHYNPWSFYREREDFSEYAHNILTMMMAECARSFEKLPIFTNIDILRNILYSGVWTKYDLLKLKEKQKQEKELK